EEAILLFQKRINYIENLGQTPSSEDYLDFSIMHMDVSDMCYSEYNRNDGHNRSEELSNKASNYVILALKAMALSKQRPELKDYLGPFYPFTQLYGCVSKAKQQKIAQAKLHFQNLKLSGLEIPEEVKNWGENLE